MEENKRLPVFKKDNREYLWNYGQANLFWPTTVWDGDGEDPPGNNVQTLEWQECDREKSSWIVKQISCLAKLIAFYNEVASLVDEGRAVDVVYLDISNAFTLRPIPVS